MAYAHRSNPNDSSRGRSTIADFRFEKKARQRPAPSEHTNAESFYYLKQMNARTPMVVTLTDGEVIHGWIEWYDRECLKVNRRDGPNLLIPKHSIKYLHKADEARG